MTDYPTLFSPLTVKTLTVKNRFVMPPMGTNFADTDGQMPDERISYYEQRARGSTGLITVENINVDYPMGSNGTTQLRIDHDRYIPTLYRLTERLHSYGTMVSIQINHAGASAMVERIGAQPISASRIPSKVGATRPARPRSRSSTTSSASSAPPPAASSRPASTRSRSTRATPTCSTSSSRPTTTSARTSTAAPRRTAPAWPRRSSPRSARTSARTPRSPCAFKEKFGTPVITTGSIRHPEVAERILASGDADFVGVGRGLIADPFWATKNQHGHEVDVRKCISCNIGCAGHRIGLNRPIRCTVNPDLYFEDAYRHYQVQEPTRVVVIGGGSTGMEAAATAAEVGCDVVLLEKQDQLGGLSAEISRIPDKARIGEYRDWMVHRIEGLENVEVRTGVEPTIEDIEALHPDVLVNATGSVPLAPPIQGLRERADQPGSKIRSITTVMDEAAELAEAKGRRVVVVGGGAVGLDVVELFAENNDVTVVERLPMVGRDLDPVSTTWINHVIEEYGVKVMTETDLVEVRDDSFLVSEWGDEHELPFDLGFVCLGMKANANGVAELTQHFTEQGVEVLNIGDSRAARRIIDGTREARDIVVTLRNIGRLPAPATV